LAGLCVLLQIAKGIFLKSRDLCVNVFSKCCKSWDVAQGGEGGCGEGGLSDLPDYHIMNTASKLGPHTHTHRTRKRRTSAVLFYLFATEGSSKKGESRALVVNGHIRILRYRIRPLPAAPLVVRCRYLIVVPKAVARGATR
jgi:hypothetical protein